MVDADNLGGEEHESIEGRSEPDADLSQRAIRSSDEHRATVRCRCERAISINSAELAAGAAALVWAEERSVRACHCALARRLQRLLPARTDLPRQEWVGSRLEIVDPVRKMP